MKARKASGQPELTFMTDDADRAGRPDPSSMAAVAPLSVPDRIVSSYCDGRHSITSISKNLGLTYHRVRSTLLNSGVALRPASCGLSYRGLPVPSPDELRRLIHEKHATLAEVGRMFGVLPGSIAYHLDKHGIPRPDFRNTIYKGKPPEVPPESQLRELYEAGQILDDIAARFSVSRAVLVKWFKTYGIPVRADGFASRRHPCDSGILVRSSYERRVADWLHTRGLTFTYEPRLPFNSRCRADFFVNGWYVEIWGMAKMPQYQARRARKEKYYSDMGFALIGIESWDFAAGRDAWERKLSPCLSPPDPIPSPSRPSPGSSAWKGRRSPDEAAVARLCCLNAECPDFRLFGAGNLSVNARYGPSRSHLLIRCRTCKSRFADRKGTALSHSSLPPDTISAILRMFGEGLRDFEIVKATGICRNTIARYRRVTAAGR
jgi:hypothetical protein